MKLRNLLLGASAAALTGVAGAGQLSGAAFDGPFDVIEFLLANGPTENGPSDLVSVDNLQGFDPSPFDFVVEETAADLIEDTPSVFSATLLSSICEEGELPFEIADGDMLAFSDIFAVVSESDVCTPSDFNPNILTVSSLDTTDFAAENFVGDGDVDILLGELDIQSDEGEGLALFPDSSFIDTETLFMVEFSAELAGAIVADDSFFFDNRPFFTGDNDGLPDSLDDADCGDDVDSNFVLLSGGLAGTTEATFVLENAEECQAPFGLAPAASDVLLLSSLEGVGVVLSFEPNQSTDDIVTPSADLVLLADTDEPVDNGITVLATGSNALVEIVDVIGPAESDAEAAEISTESGQLLFDTGFIDNIGEFYIADNTGAPVTGFGSTPEGGIPFELGLATSDLVQFSAVGVAIAGLPEAVETVTFSGGGVSVSIDVDDAEDIGDGFLFFDLNDGGVVAGGLDLFDPFNEVEVDVTVDGDTIIVPSALEAFVSLDFFNIGASPAADNDFGLEAFDIALGPIAIEACAVELGFFAGVFAQANGFDSLFRFRNLTSTDAELFLQLTPDTDTAEVPPGSGNVVDFPDVIGPFQFSPELFEAALPGSFLTDGQAGAFNDDGQLIGAPDGATVGGTLEIQGAVIEEFLKAQSGEDIIFGDQLGSRATLTAFIDSEECDMSALLFTTNEAGELVSTTELTGSVIQAFPEVGQSGTAIDGDQLPVLAADIFGSEG
ncbi:MAG: hypothetical protein ACFB2Z_08165 [Maricaulaceae bacterium]